MLRVYQTHCAMIRALASRCLVYVSVTELKPIISGVVSCMCRDTTSGPFACESQSSYNDITRMICLAYFSRGSCTVLMAMARRHGPSCIPRHDSTTTTLVSRLRCAIQKMWLSLLVISGGSSYLTFLDYWEILLCPLL